MANILFCMNCYPGIGGVESITSTLIDHLGGTMEISVVSFYHMEGIALPSKVKTFRSLAGLSSTQRAKAYNSIIEENKITHVISQGMYPHLTDLIFNRFRDKSVKVISVLHGMPGYERIEVNSIYESYRPDSDKWNFFRRIGIDGLVLGKKKAGHLRHYMGSYRTAASEGDSIVLLADGYIDELCSIYSLHEYRDKMTAIPNCLPASWSRSGSEGTFEKKNTAVFVGRLAKEKRVDRLLRAWAGSKFRNGWRLKIIGDGPCRKELEKQVMALGLKDVVFEGYSSNAAEYYREAKISLLMSEYEGFPMTLIEAQHFAAVPVASDVSAGVHSILEDGGGILVADGDESMMSEVLDSLMSDEAYLTECSGKAAAKAVQWAVDTVGEKWKTLIKNI